jgi:hypothetical protein
MDSEELDMGGRFWIALTAFLALWLGMHLLWTSLEGSPAWQRATNAGKDVPLSNDAVALQSLIEYGTYARYHSWCSITARGIYCRSRAVRVHLHARSSSRVSLEMQRIDIYTSTLEAVTRAAYQKLLELTTTPKMGFSAGRS